VRRRWSLILAGAVLLSGCDVVEKMEKRHFGSGPPPIPPEVLAAVDTTTVWLGDPRAGKGETPVIGIVVLWNGFDPRCVEMIPAAEAWHEAYARYGVRITGLHFTPYDFAGDTAVVAAAMRRLGVRFSTAVVAVPPPAALAAGRGPVVVWPGGGDPAPLWLSTPSDVRVFEARLRAKLRRVVPEGRFPEEGPLGIARSPEAPATRTIALRAGGPQRGPLRSVEPDRAQPFVEPFRTEQENALDTPVPVGWWTPRRGSLEAARGGAANYLAIRYDAGAVGLVLAPPAGSSGRVWILQDEHWIAAADAGPDVRWNESGAAFVEVTETRPYAITRGGRHVLKLSPEKPGIRFYALTFEAAAARP
jgi:hypothetical protein